MDTVINTVSLIILIPIVIVILAVAFVIFKLRYKIAKSNQALVISGGKKTKKAQQGPTVLVSGGAFISPFKRHEFFPLAVMTVSSDDKKTQTKTVVPVVVKWTAQLKPDIETEGSLAKAVMGFIGKSDKEIADSLQQTLEGEVRAVIATLTPEEVIEGRDKFKSDVEANVQERMAELGFKLISLNITEVGDDQGHYDNLAAKDREERRREAENLRAKEQQSIDETAAATSRASEEARIAKDLAIAEKDRDLKLKKSEYQAETDKAGQDALYAGRIREQERAKELANSEGAVMVERERQNQAAAEARRNVETTMAETAKQKAKIDAESAAQKAEIDAKARVIIAEQDAEAKAKAAEREAGGQAEADKRRAEGKATARKTEAEAEAEFIKKTRFANADGIAAEGRAEAEAIREKGLAEAEAERAKAEALAANEAVNLQVTLAEIESKTRIQVSTAIATAVAEVGTNATIIDMGGSGHREEGNLLTNFLGSLPETLAKMDVKSAALNGASASEVINALSAALQNKEAIGGSELGTIAKKVIHHETPEGQMSTTITVTPVAEISEDAEDVVSPPEEKISENTNTDSEDAKEEPVVTAVEEKPEPEDVNTESKQADEGAWTLPFDGSKKAVHDTPVVEEVVEAVVAEEVVEAVAAEEVVEAVATEEVVEAETIEAPEDNPILVAEAKGAVADIVQAQKLGAAETEEIAKIYTIAKDSGLDDKEALDLVAKGVGAVKTMHKSGERVDPKAVAKVMLDLDASGNVGTDEIIDLLANFGKKAAAKKR
ncbi:MAG: hypothetical protein LBU41_00550 [Clostridiales Family XIII bacterium]|jgi:flotillin|nr:hypothetical protein [Clostridiales Family XIII bacterium]